MPKFSLLSWVLLLALGWASSLPGLQAQICTPDPAYTTPGTYPATIPAGCVGTPYETTITVVVPVDTFISSPFPVTVPFDSVVINGILGVPAGISYACAQPNCTFPGGSSGCVLVSGTPTTAGSYDVDIVATYYVTLFGSPFTFVDTAFDYYTLEVLGGVTASVTTSPASCGGSDGSATITPTSGVAPFSYLWDTGDTTATVSGLAASLYLATVTDSNGCSVDIQVNVPNAGSPPVIDTTAAISWSGCAEDDGGQIMPAVSGGTGAYSYAWSSGDTTAMLDNLPAGTYNLTVTDTLGCASSASFQVDAPATLTASLDATTDALCYGDANGTAIGLATGGLPPYAYSWNSDPVQTGQIADLLPAGDYVLTVTDSLGCVKTKPFTINQPDSLGVTFAVTDASGPSNADGQIVATAFGGIGGYSYDWSTGATGDTLSDLLFGTYVVTVEDVNGCTVTDSVFVSSPISSLSPLQGIQMARVYPNPAHTQVVLEMELDQ
ncbi:MAG: hypothetical protein D6722_08865, partial [Bacteroidetes bacterium]